MEALVKAVHPGKIVRFEGKLGGLSSIAKGLEEQRRLRQYCAGVAEMYKAAAQLVIAQLGDPSRMAGHTSGARAS